MPTRVREQDSYESGSWTNTSTGYQQVVNRRNRWDFMVDTADEPRRDHDLYFHRRSVVGSVGNGLVSGRYEYSNYPSRLDVSNYEILPDYPFPETAGNMYSRMARGTAPLRAEFGVPTFLAELKDVPGTIRYGIGVAMHLRKLSKLAEVNIRNRGALASAQALVDSAKRYTLGKGVSDARKLGAASLALQFGFGPMVSDALAMAGVAQSIERRRRELEKLSKRGVLTRVWDGDEFSTSSTQRRVIDPEAGHEVDMLITTSARRWATMRWSVGANTLLPKGDMQLIQTMLGLNPQGVLLAAWEAMPWSWFIDYFSNVGDVLAATANGIQYTVTGAVMTNQQLRAYHGSSTVVGPGTNHTLSPGYLKKEIGQRQVFGGIPGVSFFGDILSPKQMSILGSLAAVKGLAK